MNDRPIWFSQKRYGFGAGLPVAWQGWAISIAYVLLVLLAVRYLQPTETAFWIAVVSSPALSSGSPG
jgi:hypothetical protein